MDFTPLSYHLMHTGLTVSTSLMLFSAGIEPKHAMVPHQLPMFTMTESSGQWKFSHRSVLGRNPKNYGVEQMPTLHIAPICPVGCLFLRTD
jgi:hypothetical protein